MKGASIRTRNDGFMVPRSLETLGSINTLGKAVGLTGAFRGHIFGLGAAAVAVVATATAVFSWPPAAAAAVSLSAAGGRLLVVSFLTGVVFGVGWRSGLQQINNFYSICMSFFCNTGSVVDPDPAIQIQVNPDPDPIRIQVLMT